MERYILLMVNHIFTQYFKPGIKPPVNQISIIRILARQGKKSIKDLTIELNKSQPNISNAVKELSKLDTALLKKTNPPKDFVGGRGNTQQFYKLTANGFKVAIDDPLKKPKNHNWKQITSREFWQYLFENFGSYNGKIINEICNFYEVRILGVDRRWTVPIMFDKCVNNKTKK